MDLDQVPELDLRPFSHLIFSLKKKNFHVADLLSGDPDAIAKSCPLPRKDVVKLCLALTAALQKDTLRATSKKREAEHDIEDQAKSTPKISKPVSNPNLRPARLCITTLDAKLDFALIGGIRTATVTEIVGEGGSGKSTLAMTLALSVQLEAPRGLGKSAIYISTEGRLNTERLNQILKHSDELSRLPFECRPTLVRVHTIYTPHLEMQNRAIAMLHHAVEEYDAGLIILDSMAANIRAECESHTPAQLGRRSELLHDLGETLRNIAIEHNIAVIVINQVSDRFNNSDFQYRSSSPLISSSPAMPNRDLPPLVAQRRYYIQSLDYQQQFFTGWGEEIGQFKLEQMKTPTMGLSWANETDCRIVLKMEHVGDREKKRSFAVVKAPWAPSTNLPIPYNVEWGGIKSMAKPAKEVETTSSPTLMPSQREIEAFLEMEDDDEEFPL
jgi:DNA repair protein RAD57